MSNKVIGVTGHRDLSHSPDDIKKVLRASLQFLKDDKGYAKVITGMAMGYDLLVAETCIDLNIPFVAAVAFLGQEEKWGLCYRLQYNKAMNHATETHIISEGGWANWKYLKRDTWIADNCDMLLAYWSGKQPSGTHFTMKEAINRNKPVKNIFSLVGGD